MYVENCTSIIIDKDCRIDRANRVICPCSVLLAGRDLIHAGRVDWLDFPASCSSVDSRGRMRQTGILSR